MDVAQSRMVESRAYEPSGAEVVRSVMQAASSLTAVANGSRHELLGPDIVVVERGRLWLRAPADSRLAREAAMVAGEPAGLPVLLEWTDVAPLAVRERVRARVRIAGRLSATGREQADGAVPMALDVRQVALAAAGAGVLVDPAELVRAEPDPLATVEAALLIHLAEDHQDHVAALLGLIDPQLLCGVTEVSPLALDRYGIVLRLADPGTRRVPPSHRDVRLSFGEPLPDADQVGHRLHALLAGHGDRHGARPA